MDALRRVLSPRSSSQESSTSGPSSNDHDDEDPHHSSSSPTSSRRQLESFTAASKSSFTHRQHGEASQQTTKQSPDANHHDNDSSRPPPFHWRLEHSLASAAMILLIIQFLMIPHVPYKSAHNPFDFGQAGENLQLELALRKSQQQQQSRCAINFWGLPRAFASLVLPSIERNVVQVNAKYGCDYYMHYFVLEEEVAGRSGDGGSINPLEVFQLRPRVKRIHQSQGGAIGSSGSIPHKPIVEFASTTDQDFWTIYQDLLTKIHDTVDSSGAHVYYPDNAKTYTFPTTTDNIIKMWHTIQESWRLMEHHERRQNIAYDRVAMLRNDVVYATPIDIYQVSAAASVMDVHNSFVVVPGFGRHPVSDRLIYGPRNAVEIWASQRFGRMEHHVQWIQTHDPGWGLHSERFVNYTLFAAMRDLEIVNSVVEHDTICFFRARSDSSVWISDCDGAASVTLPSIKRNLEQAAASKRELIERILGRPCGALTKRTKPYAEILKCPPPQAKIAPG